MRSEIIKKLIQIAEKEAVIAVQTGNSKRPFGAVLADKTGKVIVQVGNTSKSDQDLTAHAEMNVLRKAFKKLKSVDLSSYILISNMEPCSMCASASIQAGIRTFYYAHSLEDKCNPHLSLSDIIKKSQGKFTVKQLDIQN